MYIDTCGLLPSPSPCRSLLRCAAANGSRGLERTFCFCFNHNDGNEPNIHVTIVIFVLDAIHILVWFSSAAQKRKAAGGFRCGSIPLC